MSASLFQQSVIKNIPATQIDVVEPIFVYTVVQMLLTLFLFLLSLLMLLLLLCFRVVLIDDDDDDGDDFFDSIFTDVLLVFIDGVVLVEGRKSILDCAIL
jgi:hypothetical protein